MPSISAAGALAWRLRRHLLAPVGDTTTEGVVEALVAVAAQLAAGGAELGVRTRRRASTPGDLARAVADGTVLRTFAFRGAVHLMTPGHAADHLALRAAGRMWERASWRRYYGLEPADWPPLRAVVREALADGPLTRRALGEAVTADPRFRHLAPAFADPALTLLKAFAWQGDCSLGVPRRGEPTFQRLDANPRWPGLPDVGEAGPRAVEAYLRAYGPCSARNLQYWLGEGLGVRRAMLREWLAGLGDRVATVDVEGEERLVLGDDLDELAETRPTGDVRLLPRHDQWVLGPGTADVRVVPAGLRADVSRGADLVLVGGVVAGTWARGPDGVNVTWAPGGPVPDAGALDAEIARVAPLLGDARA